MQSRFVIILMSVAGAGLLFCAGLVFGLGVMSSPKGGQHKEIAVTNEPVRVTRKETTGSNGNPNHDLTPLTPVHPGTSAPVQMAPAPQPQAAPVQPAPPQAAQAAAQPVQPAPVAQAAAPPALVPQASTQTAAEPQKPADPAPKEATAKPTPKPAPVNAAALEKPAAPSAKATPVALHEKNSCDVDACSRVYKSFRESDCTYQPYSGRRQLCVSPPMPTREASRGNGSSAPMRVPRGNKDINVQTVPREDARVTDGTLAGDEDAPAARRQIRRDITADGEDDGIDDSRVIVRHSDDDRGRYDDDGWHRRFFAPVDDDDDQ